VKDLTDFAVLLTMKSKQTQFEALVNSYSTDLYRYAVWLTHDHNVAEELVQETYLRAWKSISSLKDSKAAKAWLITILRRENARRFEKKRPESTVNDDVDPDTLLEFACDDGLVENMSLQQSLEKLPEEYREPLLLQVMGGYSCNEIADILDITSQAVMTRLFRARQKMRKLIESSDNNYALGSNR